MFCENCGAGMSADAGFCSSCGLRISAEQVTGQEAARDAQNASYTQIKDTLIKNRKSKAKKWGIIIVSSVVGFFALCALFLYVIWPRLPEEIFGDGEIPDWAIRAAGERAANETPVSNMTIPILGEHITEGGSKLTFLEDGVSDRWDTGSVFVEFAADAEYLLGGRANNEVYRYLFTRDGEPAPYDRADSFTLSDGGESFAGCKSDYWIYGDVSLRLTPYSPQGERLIFERVVSEGSGRYDIIPPGEGGYFDYSKQDD